MSTLKVDNLLNSAGNESPISVPGAAKAWVNFNGIGTVSIRKSYNVSSITDNGTGRYRINFTTAFSDADYTIVVTSDRAQAPSNIGIISTYTEAAPSTTGYSFRFSDVAAYATMQDQNYFYAAAWGD